MESQSSLSRATARFKKLASEEFGAVLSRRALAWVAGAFPTQAFNRSRTALLRQAGVHIGPSSLVQGSMHITGGGNPCLLVSIGTFSLVSGSLHCDVGAPIRIGDRVRIGHDVSLLTVDHQVGPDHMRSGKTKYGPIEIGDGAWLASRVVVLPGVRIGAGAIVAAGSVVTRDVPDHTLVVGVPARVVRNLNAEPEAEGTEPPVSSRRFLRQA
jgi:acetyltransferase-like isoleucine patch superfamily enzyme